MFIEFFYMMREKGIPMSPTGFLTLHRAFEQQLVNSLNDFYTVARSLLVKSEKYFDLYDRLFAHYFEGADFIEPSDRELADAAKLLLQDWLKNPRELARALGIDESQLSRLTPDELIKYFLDRLREQDGEHHGGNRWIGTGGTSPVGHSGFHPGGMRVGGMSRNKSAVKVALERRYKDYSLDKQLTTAEVGEALKRLRHMIPSGPRDRVNIDETIYRTTKNGGEIEIIFDRSLKDKLKVILAIDNGGWSMDPYIEVVQTLFSYARNQFKELKIYYFHNSIYNKLWEDPTRRYKPKPVTDFFRDDPETRLVIVGDASMAPYELTGYNGSINYYERSGEPSMNRLQQLNKHFPHSVWLNPLPVWDWEYTHTVGAIRRIFPMFELTLDGLDNAVKKLMSKN